MAAGHKDGNFYVYDLDNINAGPIWKRSVGCQVGMLPAYAPDNGGTLLFMGSGGVLYAADLLTAAYRWLPVTVGPMHGNMASANGLIFLNGGAGGRILRTIVPPNAGRTFSGVALSRGYLYWVAGSQLNAWSLPPR